MIEQPYAVTSFMPTKLVARIDRAAKQQRVTRAKFVREACRTYLRIHGTEKPSGRNPE